jgi:2-oxoglutarate dehydrogenase E1 component
MRTDDGSRWPLYLSYLTTANAAYLDSLFETYEVDPGSVTADWRASFDSLPTKPLQRHSPEQRIGNGYSYDNESWGTEEARKQSAVLRLINAYRSRGHLIAQNDPLQLRVIERAEDFDLNFQGLSPSDLDTVFDTGSLFARKAMTLSEIIDFCELVYCGPVGIEYMHISRMEEKRWLQARLETIPVRPVAEDQTRSTMLRQLTAAEGLERYLHTRYVGQKRFSLEGGETLIPLLSELVQRAGDNNIKEVVIGMTHRGRLNVLVNLLGKSPAEIFDEFEGRYTSASGNTDTGDVKYHQGFSSDIQTPGGLVHLALAFNPSHLEIIGPVVEGSVRARQERYRPPNIDTAERSGEDGKGRILPVLIHGDAAFAGQGVVMETLNMSNTRGFSTGGSIHVIVNNQIGFTTSNPLDARSTLYCTEVAKMVQAPILHVNGDDPDAVLFAVRLAFDFRTTFNKDVVIDLVGYRRLGHNEADEPSITQPMMYERITSLPTVRQQYIDRLIADQVIQQSDADQMAVELRTMLDAGLIVADHISATGASSTGLDWTRYLNSHWTDIVDTTVAIDRIQAFNRQLQALPSGFVVHPRIEKLFHDRDRMVAGDLPVDWGFAETMAYASLIDEGFSVRLSGQDSGRGTFSHRHAVIKNIRARESFVPLRSVGPDPNQFLVINSLLSEEAVLAFEYGYSTTEPGALVIWEAQFGDFANGAQVVIDQFISSGEAKWGRLCGLTLFLPHGYEGQGPEHSSARLERYLQLCAEQNIQVCVPTTPAQFFHVLRRQMIRPLRRPLILMTPKSLLRHKQSASSLSDLSTGEFQAVIDDNDCPEKKNVKRVVLSSGKVYFDLLKVRQTMSARTAALVRVEQLHPFPLAQLQDTLSRYPNARSVVWCQEEPRNQGAWYQIRHHLRSCLSDEQVLIYSGRASAAAPAVGFYQLHVDQQSALVNDALDNVIERIDPL